MGRDECSTSLYFNRFQGCSFYKANKVSLQTGKIQFSFCCLTQMSLILAKSVKTLEEDNNTSKKHITGERKEGGEQPSKGLQNKVKKRAKTESTRCYPCRTVRNGGETQFFLNRCYAISPHVTWGSRPRPSPQVGCSIPAPASQPELTGWPALLHTSPHCEEISSAVLFPNTVLSHTSSPYVKNYL